jgi:hypothetical protein
MGTDFLNGVVLVPFAMMLAVPFSPIVLEYLRNSNPVIFALAGGIGLIFVVAELFNTDNHQRFSR